MTLGISSLMLALVWLGSYLPDQVQSLLSTKPPVAIETLQHYEQTGGSDDTVDNSEFWKTLNQTKGTNEVTVRQVYICGEEEQVLGQLSSDDIYSLMNEHPTWKGEFTGKGQIRFEETISDLSPTCKEQAYISLDKDGNLTLFEGPPTHEKVIKTFFQLDINSMESSLPDGAVQQLYDGIRVQDIDEYNSVLSTFSDYARKG